MADKIFVNIPRHSRDFASRLRTLKFELIPPLIARTQMVDIAIKPLALRDWRVAGPAITVAQPGAGTFMPIASLGVAQPGDVVVVAAQGDMSTYSWGGGLTRSARNVGVGGVVVDGAVIDTPSILQREIPVFSRGATAAQHHDDLPGSINIPVTFGGVVVSPGDYIVGDLDGLAVIPYAMVESVLRAAEDKAALIARIGERMDTEGVTLFGLRGGRATTEAAGIEWVDNPV